MYSSYLSRDLSVIYVNYIVNMSFIHCTVGKTVDSLTFAIPGEVCLAYAY